MTRTSVSDQGVSRREVLKRGVAASAAGVTVVAASGGATAADCDAVVPDDYPTIQAAVDAASAGDAVCVRGGTYAETVEVATPVTLRGESAPASSDAAVVDGWVSVEPAAAGATLRDLRITRSGTYPGGTVPDPFGVRVKAGGVTVENNVVEGLSADLSNGGGSVTLHGIQVFGADGANVSDVTVRGNVVRGFRSEGVPGEWPKYGGIAGVKLQAGVDGATVARNRVVDHHSAGWVWGVVLTSSGSAPGLPTDITVERNHLAGLNDGSVYDVFTGGNGGRNAAPYPGSAFGIDGAADADGATVRRNDLLAPNGAESKDGDGVLDAECNWWGARSGPTHDDNPGGGGTWALERGGAGISYMPWLVAPAPSGACVGGERGRD